ncbi:CRAL-TRIO domain-containing protein [Coemansia spiralis]|nr:CRAL-TRIO domain-containing protein [Coemansia spiralis]
MHVDQTPGATTEEQAVVDAIAEQRSELLRDLPQEPEDATVRFDADKWLSEQIILIYVRANKGDKDRAFKQLRNTLEWRCTYRPHAITPESMKTEAATGKQYVNGYDKGGRPIAYMFPHRQNTKDAERNLRWVVYTMEQAIRSMPPGATKTTIVIDASKYTMSQAVPLSTAREFLNILSSHYPERLHKAFVISPPTYFVMFYHIIAPFIDPVTKAKIAFVDLSGSKSDGPWVDIFDHIEPEQLESDAGGRWDFKFTQDAYWPELEKSYQTTL